MLFPQRHDEESDNDDFFDVAQQLQQAEIRERLKTIVESNRGIRSRRMHGTRSHKETVSSLRQASFQRHTRFPSLSAVSEASSEAPIPESSQQPFYSVAGHDLRSEALSSSGAPASGEDELSVFREGSLDDDGVCAPPQPPESNEALALHSDFYATKDELASVLACLRRLERKVDWLMSQERKVRVPDPATLSLTGCFYKAFWLPLKAALWTIWPCRLFIPVLDLVESVAHYVLN